VAAVPTGGSAPVAGDALYIIMESSDSSVAAGTPTTPDGWSKLFENTIAPATSSVSTLTVFGKIAGAGETNVTVDGVGDHCAGAMVVIRDHGLSVIGDTVVGAATGHGTQQANNLAPSITVTAASLIITCMGLSDDAADTTNVSGVTNANLANIVEQRDRTVATGAGGGVGIYTSTCAGTSTGTTEWDHDTAVQSQSMQMGIKPVASVTYTYAASGGAQSGGVASLAKGKAYTSSGGASSGGVALLAKVKDFIAVGGAQSGGTALLTKVKAFLAAGGASSGGAAMTSYVSGGATTYTYTASGGGQSGGASVLAKVKAFVASGGGVSAGAALLAKTKAFLASGGANSGGSATLVKTKAFVAEGGAVSGGLALLAMTKAFAASGGATAGGTAITSYSQYSESTAAPLYASPLARRRRWLT